MTPADFIATFPKFQQVDPVDIQRWIDRVTISPSFSTDWGDDLDEAMGNLVAHGLIEEGVRGVPVAVDAPSGAGSSGGSWRAEIYMLEADPLTLTIYGRKYLRMRDARFGIGALIV